MGKRVIFELAVGCEAPLTSVAMSDKGEGEQEWVLIKLDERLARRQGMPLRVPIPKDKFEGLADDGLTAEKLKGWIKDFLENAPVAKDGTWRRRESATVSQLEAFIDKGPLWDKAQKLFAEREFDKALKTLKRITIMAPEDHAAKMNYASALANQGQHDKAFKQYREIRETFKGEPEYHVSVAQILVARGDQDGAIEELLAALEAEPGNFAAMDALAKLGVLARVYLDPKDAQSLIYVRADAVSEYLLGLWDSEEHDPQFFIEHLGYHQGEKRYELALEAAERAIKRSGDELCEPAEVGRITMLRALDRDDEALAAAKAYVDRAGSCAAYVELSACHAKAKDMDAARAAVDKALEKDPGDQLAIAMRFWPPDRNDMMKVQAVVPDLEDHANAHPEAAGAWRSLARARLVVQDAEGALNLFEQAVALAPDDDDLRSEWWAELAAQQKWKQIVADAEKLGNMPDRGWQLRWNEAEAYRGLNRVMEARACFMTINSDERLHVDIRKRAKRAAMEMGAGVGGGAADGGASAS